MKNVLFQVDCVATFKCHLDESDVNTSRFNLPLHNVIFISYADLYHNYAETFKTVLSFRQPQHELQLLNLAQ